MNLLDLPWELILIILKQYNDYKYCIRLLVTCKQLYNNELLMKEIKNHFTEYIVNKYGNQSWYFNGKHHREGDKPAFIDRDGYKEWLFNGKTHRENGPAIIHPDGYKYWYLNDIPYTEVEYWEEIKKINEKID